MPATLAPPTQTSLGHFKPTREFGKNVASDSALFGHQKIGLERDRTRRRGQAVTDVAELIQVGVNIDVGRDRHDLGQKQVGQSLGANAEQQQHRRFAGAVIGDFITRPDLDHSPLVSAVLQPAEQESANPQLAPAARHNLPNP